MIEYNCGWEARAGSSTEAQGKECAEVWVVWRGLHEEH